MLLLGLLHCLIVSIRSSVFDRHCSIVSIRSSLFDRHCSIVTVRSSLFDRLVIPTPKAEESATPRSCGASEDLNHRSAGHARPSLHLEPSSEGGKK